MYTKAHETVHHGSFQADFNHSGGLLSKVKALIAVV
jgi:hypothetical protein